MFKNNSKNARAKVDDNQLISTMIDIHSQVSAVAQHVEQLEQSQRDVDAHLDRLDSRIDAIERKLAKWSGIAVSIVVAYEFFRPSLEAAILQ